MLCQTKNLENSTFTGCNYEQIWYFIFPFNVVTNTSLCIHFFTWSSSF